VKAVFIIQADGAIIKTEQRNIPSLQQLQKAVGGFIELIPHFTRFEYKGKLYRRGTAYANEEGLYKRLPYNHQATQAWKACLSNAPLVYEPRLCGNIIFYASTVK
jgi:hypothetical protein